LLPCREEPTIIVIDSKPLLIPCREELHSPSVSRKRPSKKHLFITKKVKDYNEHAVIGKGLMKLYKQRYNKMLEKELRHQITYCFEKEIMPA
jgi:hypothetical protein